jgi:hypothetical protein
MVDLSLMITMETNSRTETPTASQVDESTPATGPLSVSEVKASSEMPIVDETAYPSVDLAYDIAVASYDSIIKRLDVMDGRLQTILAFAATTTAVVPTVANARGLTFRSWWLYLALTTFVLQLVIGTVARSAGRIRLLKPETFYLKWLHKSAWQFKKDLIYWSSKDFNDNAALLERRWRLTVTISLLFFIEVLLLLVWVAARV